MQFDCSVCGTTFTPSVSVRSRMKVTGRNVAFCGKSCSAKHRYQQPGSKEKQSEAMKAWRKEKGI